MGALPVEWKAYGRKQGFEDGYIVEEALVSIYVNGMEIASLMASPSNQDWLAVGFLKNGRFIESASEIESLHISKRGCCVDLWLSHEMRQPEKKIITSGCGGGIIFEDPETVTGRIDSTFTIPRDEIFRLFEELQQASELHVISGGVHSSALCRDGELLVVVEDIGRHNTIDKICGYALLNGVDTRGSMLLTTGRISSEMMVKTALMGCPVVASRKSPTSLSLEIASAWNISLIGYVKRRSMRVYTHAGRIKDS